VHDLVHPFRSGSVPFATTFSSTNCTKSKDAAFAQFVERFTLAEDGSRLDYRLTVTDPNTFTEAVELEKYWLYIPGITVEPYECSNR